MKKLFIDLELCYKCKKIVPPKFRLRRNEGGPVSPKSPDEGGCIAECSYFYHPDNDGVSTLLERATRMLVCRQCEAAPCVAGCVFDALEKTGGRQTEKIHHALHRMPDVQHCLPLRSGVSPDRPLSLFSMRLVPGKLQTRGSAFMRPDMS